MRFYVISIPMKVIVKLQIRHQLDIERPCLRERSERKSSVFERVSRHYNLADWILSSFPLKTQVKGFYEKISANCFKEPVVFTFIFLYNCFRTNSKQKLLWSSISFVNNSYKLLIKLFRYFDYFKTNYRKNARFFHKQHFNKQHQAETGKKLRKR